MKQSLAQLDRRQFDVVIIGGGVNGASAAQHLTSAGYSVILVDKDDFGSGSSSRSGRLSGNGLRYLASGRTFWESLINPKAILNGCRMAKLALADRAGMVKNTPERLQKYQAYYPIYKGGPFKPWQFDVAFAVLRSLGTGGVPLGYKRMKPDVVRNHPLLRRLRNPEQLAGVISFDLYQFNWPERIVVDAALRAEEMGATIRNYTTVVGLKRDMQGLWQVRLRDNIDGSEGAVTGKLVLNAAGIWIDQVNKLNGAPASRKITGTKGVHIAVRLPPDCRGVALLHEDSQGKEPIYCVPWGDFHYIGPTETLYEGDLDNIRPEEDEIDWILREINHLAPGFKLTRDDVIYSWAGVRPLTNDPEKPMGLRKRTLHDQSADGMPGVLSLTGGPINSHRSAGRAVLETVKRTIPPSRSLQPLSFAIPKQDKQESSPAFVNEDNGVTISMLRHAAEKEHVRSLTDLLFRRVPLAWTAESLGTNISTRAAESVADILGWDKKRVEQEVMAYEDSLRRLFVRSNGPVANGRSAALASTDEGAR